MIETEDQRRWWFATHPDYSWSHRGIKGSKPAKNDNKVDPKEVDAYVDRALKYETGPVADLLRSVKRNFGTEGQTRQAQTSDRLEWDTEAGGRIGPRPGPRPGRGSRRGLDIRDWVPMTRRERLARDEIEAELELAGANARDYHLTVFAGQLVAQRRNLFDPCQTDLQGRTNIQRMRDGRAPLDRNGDPIELHHINQRSDAPIIELTKEEHQAIRVQRETSRIDRVNARNFRETYWMARATSIRSPEPELSY